MNSLARLAQQAGLHTLDQAVTLPNFEFPVISPGRSDPQGLPEPLFCSGQFGVPADLTLLYFTLPDCENCRSGAHFMDRIQSQWADAPEGNVPSVCARIVVSDWPTSPEVGIESAALGLQKIGGIVWDAQGVLSERLAVVAQPAFFLFDKKGLLLAYQNGPVEFSSPGFEVFWKSLLTDMRKAEVRSHGWTAGKIFMSDREQMSSSVVSFLNKGALSLLWLVVCVLLCYSLGRFFLRLRKNFTGSQN